ncbi:hypothetical protein [Microbacterium resistens]|uniref:hypothetical protein n=1 Tax=Microbacterium resistens TaxID=156977 RepID=UPI00366C9B3D
MTRASNEARTARRTLATAATVIAASLFTLVPGTAFGDDSVTPIADEIVVDGVTYVGDILQPYTPGAPIELAGGSARTGSVDTPATQASMCTTGFVVPGDWATHYSVENCFLFGLDDTVRTSYTWTINPFSSGSLCGEGKGYRRQLDGNYAVDWNGLGCGADGSGSVHWGNVGANKRMRGFASSSPMGWSGSFE